MQVGLLHRFGDVAETIWEATLADLPKMLVELFGWLVGESWMQFGLRLSFVAALSYLIHSLWVRMSDASDKNALSTIGLLAVLMIVLLAGVGAYSAGMWRDVRPSWIP